MKLNFGERIRKYRRERDLTQDGLAQAVGVSYQSVSKWERNEGYPDIELLPVIARFFGVTVDALLGNDRTDEIIGEYERESAVYLTNRDMEKYREIWEKAYAEFPNDLRVIEKLSYTLMHGKNPDEDNKRIVSLCEQILEKSTNQHQRERAIQRLCYTHLQMGDREKALYYADMGGNIYTTATGLRCRVLEGDEGVVACQYYMMNLVRVIFFTAREISDKTMFPPEKAIEIFQFAVDVYKLLYSDGNVLYYSCDLAELYNRIAVQYAKLNDSENTLAALKDSMKYAIIHATLPEEMNYTAPLVNRTKYRASDTAKSYKGNTCNLLLDNLKDSQFNFIREDEKFAEILAELEKYAEKI